MNERVFSENIEKLRSAERLERTPAEAAVDLTLADIEAESVLDVGVGTALFAELFHSRGLRVAGIDINPAMLEAARKFLPAAELKEAPAEKIPFPDASFDIVFFGHVFHELDDYAVSLKEAFRVSSGRVAILEFPFEEQDFGPPLDHRVKPEDVCRFAREAGFGKISQKPVDRMVLYLLDK